MSVANRLQSAEKHNKAGLTSTKFPQSHGAPSFELLAQRQSELQERITELALELEPKPRELWR